MSTAIACNRPTTTEFYSDNPLSNRCSTSSSKPIESSSPTPSSMSHEENDLEIRLERMLRERDDQWRRHEKSQIQFLQNETSSMLKCLHQEVNQLQNQLREAQRKQIMGEKNEEDVDKIEQLEKKLAEKELYTKNLEKKVTATIQKLQEQIQIQSERIRQLNDELNDRNQTVTHLSQQLRAIRLREAMATSQHRRRASQQSSPPLTSPSSPHRIFPPISTGLLSASVAVTYPGSKTTTSNSASARRSNSARRSPSMPN